MPSKKDFLSYSAYLVFIILLFSTFYSCSKDGPTKPQASSEAAKIYEEIAKPQEEKFNLFEELTVSMDTMAAMDSVLKVFLQDTLVEWGEVGEQGIAIQYKNGIRGGILINPLDSPDTSDLDLFSFEKENSLDVNPQNFIPGSKRAIFLNPSYWERKKFADALIKNYKFSLPKVGFDDLEVYLNEEASLEKFTQLNDFGIIHVYTHGWPWPKVKNIQTVFLLTGEVYSINSFDEKYFDDVSEGNIRIAYSKSIKKNVILITPEFLVKYNNLKLNRPLFYGGFCFSDLGNWPQIITNTAGASGYFGFDWSVYTNWNAWWNKKLILFLTDSNNINATTFSWMNNYIRKNYWDKKQKKTVRIRYYGDSDLALQEEKDSGLYNVCAINIQYFGNYIKQEDSTYQSADGYLKVSERIPGSFTNNIFSGSYNNNDPDDPHEESIVITFNNDRSKIISVNWSRSFKSSNLGVISDDLQFNAKDIPLHENFSPLYWDVEYRILGEETCNSITYLTHKKVWDYSPNNWTHTLDFYECNQNSMIQIRFGNQ